MLMLFAISLLVFVIYAIPTSFGLWVILGLAKQRLEPALLAGCCAGIGVWIALVLISGHGKTLANLMFEPLIWSSLVLVGVVARCAVQERATWGGRGLFAATVIASAVVAAAVYALVPALPE